MNDITDRLADALIHAKNQIQHPDQMIDEALAEYEAQKSEPVSNPYKLPEDRQKALDWIEVRMQGVRMNLEIHNDLDDVDILNKLKTICKALQQPEPED